MSDLNCECCKDTGTVACLCRGDKCGCGIEFYDCPQCPKGPEIMDGEEEYAWLLIR